MCALDCRVVECHLILKLIIKINDEPVEEVRACATRDGGVDRPHRGRATDLHPAQGVI